MKRKMLVVLVAIMVVLSLVGCGNMSMGFGNYEYKKIHVDTHHHSRCFTIEKWYDSATGIEVKTEEAGFMCFSEGQYILIEDDCPFCTSEE